MKWYMPEWCQSTPEMYHEVFIIPTYVNNAFVFLFLQLLLFKSQYVLSVDGENH